MDLPGARVVAMQEARPLVAAHLVHDVVEHELMFAEPAGEGSLLIVDEDAALSGDLRLDWENAQFDGRKLSGILVRGDLTIDGDIVNTNWDGGPFLMVLGRTRVRHILKRGAPIVLVGPLEASGVVYCEYNHGAFRALGGVKAQALINDDHLCELRGPVDAIVFETRSHDPRDYLLEDFYYEEDDGEVCLIDDVAAALTANILAGKPVFRADAPRGE